MYLSTTQSHLLSIFYSSRLLIPIRFYVLYAFFRLASESQCK